MTGGTFEDCGAFPYSFDVFTVTFDSDGGSAVPEQKLRNAPAVKPADPKKNGYDFAGWYLGNVQYTFDSNVAVNITLKAHWTPTSAPTVIDVVEINDVTVSFKDGDKPVFTGNVPDGANYALRAAWWELDSKTGLISTEPEWGSEIYENKISAFEAGKTYYYGVYVTAVGFVESENTSYIFGPNTKLKINGEFVNYKRYENDTSDGSDGTLWVITDLTMTPKANDTSSDSSDTNSDSKDTSSNNSGTSTNSNSNTDSKNPAKNNAGSTNPNTGNDLGGILFTILITGSGLVVAGRRSRKNK